MSDTWVIDIILQLVGVALETVADRKKFTVPVDSRLGL